MRFKVYNRSKWYFNLCQNKNKNNIHYRIQLYKNIVSVYTTSMVWTRHILGPPIPEWKRQWLVAVNQDLCFSFFLFPFFFLKNYNRHVHVGRHKYSFFRYLRKYVASSTLPSYAESAQWLAHTFCLSFPAKLLFHPTVHFFSFFLIKNHSNNNIYYYFLFKSNIIFLRAIKSRHHTWNLKLVHLW